MMHSSSPVIGSSRTIVARWVGRPTAALLPNTLTTFVPSAGGSRDERRHHADERLLQSDFDNVRSGWRRRRQKTGRAPLPSRRSGPPSAARSARPVRKARPASSYQAYPNSISGIHRHAAIVCQKTGEGRKERPQKSRSTVETREIRANKNALPFLPFLLFAPGDDRSLTGNGAGLKSLDEAHDQNRDGEKDRDERFGIARKIKVPHGVRPFNTVRRHPRVKVYPVTLLSKVRRWPRNSYAHGRPCPVS